METKEQKIEDIFLEGNLAKVTKRKEAKKQKIKRLKEELKKEKQWYNRWCKIKASSVSSCMKWQIKQTIVRLEKEILEIENGQ